MNILKYKDYEGTAELDMSRKVCRGKILFINDLVTYEAADPSKLQDEFEAAVEDYLETCKELGRQPQKSLKGQFNVRVSSELHKASVLRAIADKTSLNDVTTKALELYVLKVDVNHIENKNYYFSAEAPKRAFASTSSPEDAFPPFVMTASASSISTKEVHPTPTRAKGTKHVATKH